jgi:hypothetical protein
VTANKYTQPIINIAKDTTEALLDNLIPLLKDYPILKDIPVLNIVHSLAQGYGSIRDHLFYKKVERFLHNLGAITENEKNNFRNEMNDEKFKSKVGENLLLIIEKLDDMDKPKIISKFFTEYIRLHITYDEFRRLCQVVINCPINTLNKIKDIYSVVERRYRITQDENNEYLDEINQEYDALDELILHDLFLCGLLRPSTGWDDVSIYEPNKLGKLYIENISR